MVRQQIIWTVLPNGFKPGTPQTLMLSVFLSPRLSFDGANEHEQETLAAFLDFHDWPRRLADLTLDIIVDDEVANPIPATIAAETPLDSELWKALFPPETLVISHAPDFAVREPISTYPASTVESSIAEGYNALGKSSPYLPAEDAQLTESFAPIYRAMMPDREEERGLERLRNIDVLAPEMLDTDHQLVSTTLLRHDAGISFDEKLTAAREIAGRLANARTQNGHVVVPLIRESNDPTSAFAQFAAFHRRARRPGRVRRQRALSLSEPVKEFHEIVSSLGEHPELLRRLGLVVDIEVDASALPEARQGAVRRLRAAPSLALSPPSPFTTPFTFYLFSRTGHAALPIPTFCAAPKGAEQPPNPMEDEKFEIVGGFLNLRLLRPDDPARQTPQFSLLQVDLDGAGLKLLNALDAIAAGSPGGSLQTANAGAPTLRSSGLSLVRARFAQGLMAGVDRAKDLEASGEHPELFAEDLVRGYRVDVRRFAADVDLADPEAMAAVPWYSLHRRIGKFRIPRAEASEIERSSTDEGFIQAALTQEIDDDEAEEPPGSRPRARPIYVSESLFHWQGWSLSAPPPTTALQPEILAPERAPQGELRPVAEFEPAPHSLPRLRFGHHYQLRARVVDLAGNSHSTEQADTVLQAIEMAGRKQPVFPPAPKDFIFRRFDPIPPPALVLREELTEGEAPDVLVIRSDEGLSASAYAAGLDDPRYKGVNERHIVPPKAAQRMTEMHGMYEAAFGEGGDPASSYAICSKESGTLNDTHVVNVVTGALEPLPDFVDPQTGNRVPFGLKFVSVPAEVGEYAIHYEETLLLPYLPDPFARGAALFGLPGTEGKAGNFNNQTGELSYSGPQLLPNKARRDLGSVTKIGFGREWPGRLPFRLQLSDGPTVNPAPLPQWDANARVLTVQLPPGETATLWISSYPNKDDVNVFGLYAWWDDHVGSSAEQGEFLNAAQHGALTMLSPAHKVMLVHAVQKPLRLAKPSPSSTLDIRRFENDTAAYFGGSFLIHGPSTAKLDLWAEWKEPGEHGPSTAKLELSAERKEPAERGEPPSSVNVHVLELPIHPKGMSMDEAAFADEKPIATYAEGRAESFGFLPPPNVSVAQNYNAKHDFGDTKHRKVKYTLTATSRFPEYFPKSITSDINNITRSITLEEAILSSARPAAPEIADVVPIMSKEEFFDVSDLVESRRRGGLRIYLGPTWYSSGEEEKLAVIGRPRWGIDPVHSFLADETATQIEPEAPAVIDIDGTIYPYSVEYSERDQSYFADVIFKAGTAYFPFVALTLARYQPNALTGLHLSANVDAGIHQLMPERSTRLSYPPASQTDPGRRIDIVLDGKRPSAVGHVPPDRGYRIEVTLEERSFRQGDPDKDLRWNPANLGQPVPDPSPLEGSLWSGHVFVPRPDTTERRILIREFELFPPNTDPPGQAWIGGADDNTGFSRRLIYADTISLF